MSQKMKGLMSFYALVTNFDQLRDLDGWMKWVVVKGYETRCDILEKKYKVKPYKLTDKQLLDGSWYRFKKYPLETRLPSFIRGWRAARKYYATYGPQVFETPMYYNES